MVADVRDEHKRGGKADARQQVVYNNETESNLLMSSLTRRLYEDKGARRIVMRAGPLFDGARKGFVYVLRSRSDRPHARGLLKVGTTSGAVEDRVARAETQGAFLFAPVEIVETFELVGHDAKGAEKAVHAALRPFHVALQVVGPDGRRFNATEWFKTDVATVVEAISKTFPRATLANA